MAIRYVNNIDRAAPDALLAGLSGIRIRGCGISLGMTVWGWGFVRPAFPAMLEKTPVIPAEQCDEESQASVAVGMDEIPLFARDDSLGVGGSATDIPAGA
ncbi:MAG TPA: hypothetical protein VJ417_16800 [Candidatus Glassbacteria bacterium]|nr:hypothetical protein [Candidatus Glassbacteria bacterium]